jgi:DNA-directed RNA polymerase specialized sigma subunit
VLTKRAIESYDPNKNTKLQTHVMNQLRQLQREAFSYNTLHVPERVRFDLSDIRKVHNKFVDENGREPNDDELADATGISTKRIAKMRLYDRSLVNESVLAESDTDDDASSLPAVHQAARVWEDAVYDSLSDIDKLLYDLRLGRNGRKELPVKAIARKLKMTPSAVSQRLKRINERLTEGADIEF